MDACNKMTKEQALKEMELFKAVFDGGRLIDAHALKMMEKGYTDMGDINSEIAESGLAADNEALIIYEEILSECKQ